LQRIGSLQGTFTIWTMSQFLTGPSPPESVDLAVTFGAPFVESLQVTVQAKQRTYFYFHNTYLPLYFAEKFEEKWEALQSLHPDLKSRGLANLSLSSLAETDTTPFAFFSSLFCAIKDDVADYITDSSRSNRAIASGKLKSKAQAAVKRNMDSDASSFDMDSSSAERIVKELEVRALKRGRTKSGARKRLRWTPQEDKLLAEMYLKYEGQKMLFVTISSYFEHRSNEDCLLRFKSVARSNGFKKYSYKQIAKFILLSE